MTTLSSCTHPHDILLKAINVDDNQKIDKYNKTYFCIKHKAKTDLEY